MKPHIELVGPGMYVPEAIPRNIITNQNLEDLATIETSDDWITRMTGMKERRISWNKGVKEMGLLAAKELIDKIKIDPACIDEVIFATNRHDEEKEFPSHAAYIANSIKARKGIPTHDEAAGCTGIVYAIRQAYNNVLSGDVDSVLVIGGERLTDMTDYSDRNTCVLFGDGAGAYLVRKSEKQGIINNVVRGEPDTGGAGWPDGYLAMEKKMGKKLRLGENNELETYDKEQNYLVMKGKKIFHFAVNAMEEAVLDVLKDTGYTLEDVDVIVPHGANARIIEAAQGRLEKKNFKGIMYTNLEKYGNTSTASIPLAAAEAVEKGVITKGKLCINVAFGAGLTYGANLYRAA